MGAFGKLKWYIQILIVSAVCGALLGGVWYFFLNPISVTIAAQTIKNDKLVAEIKKAREQAAAQAKFKKEKEALLVILAERKKELPQDKDTDQLLNSVQTAAGRSGLKIQSGVSKPGIDSEVYTEYPLDMEVVGTYHSLGAFLEKIRKLDRIVNIDKLRIRSRVAEGEAATTESVGANYEAKTYVYREEVEKAPAAKAGKGK